MANLSYIDRKRLETFLGMGGGYVLDFSNNSFQDFVAESTGLNIYDEKYEQGGHSKANRLRSFWQLESNHVVSRLLTSLVEYWEIFVMAGRWIPDEEYKDLKFVKALAEQLKTELGEHVDAIQPNSDDEDFAKLAKVIRESIEQNDPASALDRLHTFVVKHLRTLCEKHDVPFNQDTPLHSLVGAYIKHLQRHNMLESQMSEIILKSSISVLQKFNDVRNNQSYAHANDLLNYNESLLIFKNISALIEFIDSVEIKFNTPEKTANQSDELPF